MQRRTFLCSSLAAVGAASLPVAAAASTRPVKFGFGLVTYQWGRTWDLSTLLKNCAAARALGVELRTTHAHKVEPSLNRQQRREVRRQFADSPVELVGLGSNERFDNPDPAVVRQALETTRKFIVLSHDVGSSGVKVKPDRFHEGVPREQTIAQIARALNALGSFAAGYGQQIRLEVHGQCAELPTIKAIMDRVAEPNVAICWNCNPQDLAGQGLAHNFRLVRDRFGHTVHVRRMDNQDYPTRDFLGLLADTDYSGWVLLESSRVPENPAAGLAEQVRLFDRLVDAL